MSIADQLNTLRNTKAAIRAAITAKGQTISDNDAFATYADKIAAIETGGTALIDINGLQIRRTITQAEFEPLWAKVDKAGITAADYLFYQCAGITGISSCPFGNATTLLSCFANCAALQSVGDVVCSSATTLMYTFYQCKALTAVTLTDTDKVSDFRYCFNGCAALSTIGKFSMAAVKSKSYVTNMFKGCTSLADVEGFTGLAVSLDLSECTALTAASAVNIFAEAATITTAQTITLSDATYALLTEAQISIATEKGWAVASPSNAASAVATLEEVDEETAVADEPSADEGDTARAVAD